MGGPPARGLGEVLTISHNKSLRSYKTLYKASDSGQKLSLVNSVLNFMVLSHDGNFLTS